ncbi:MAG: helix-turn-helix domain-containing protein [Lachnospiraceae bacterium]|nr:helix-turn-helix domain-containing protein [Lachnospiraceae bacterium]
MSEKINHSENVRENPEENMGKSAFEKPLEEIRSITGIPFQLADHTISDEELEKRLTFLLKGLKASASGLSQTDLLRQLLTGELSSDEAFVLLERSHFRTEGCFGLLLLRFDKIYRDQPDTLAILREITEVSSTFYLEMNEHDLVLLLASDQTFSPDYLKKAAAEICDTMAAEAMQTIRLAFDRPANQLSDLPKIYQNLLLSMKVGSIFLSSEQIYNFRDLGLGKLISRLPRQACIDYLEESLPGVDFSQIDEETWHTIRTFFASGLNIAETARNLYLHRNTLVYRLDKFKRTTGLDLRDFDDAVKCRIGMMISAYLKNEDENSSVNLS